MFTFFFYLQMQENPEDNFYNETLYKLSSWSSSIYIIKCAHPHQPIFTDLTLCESTARSTKLRKKAILQERLLSEKEALLLITTSPCPKVFVSLITKNKSKSSLHTEKFAKSRLKEKSSGKMRTKRQNRKECCFLLCFSSSPGH